MSSTRKEAPSEIDLLLTRTPTLLLTLTLPLPHLPLSHSLISHSLTPSLSSPRPNPLFYLSTHLTLSPPLTQALHPLTLSHPHTSHLTLSHTHPSDASHPLTSLSSPSPLSDRIGARVGWGRVTGCRSVPVRQTEGEIACAHSHLHSLSSSHSYSPSRFLSPLHSHSYSLAYTHTQ